MKTERESRVEFEEWYRGGHTVSLTRSRKGNYTWAGPSSAWKAWRAAWDRAAQSPVVAPDTVPMPQNADQAALMALLGTKWLEDNAPERLKAAPPYTPAVPSAPPELPNELATLRRFYHRWEALNIAPIHGATKEENAFEVAIQDVRALAAAPQPPKRA